MSLDRFPLMSFQNPLSLSLSHFAILRLKPKQRLSFSLARSHTRAFTIFSFRNTLARSVRKRTHYYARGIRIVRAHRTRVVHHNMFTCSSQWLREMRAKGVRFNSIESSVCLPYPMDQPGGKLNRTQSCLNADNNI